LTEALEKCRKLQQDHDDAVKKLNKLKKCTEEGTDSCSKKSNCVCVNKIGANNGTNSSGSDLKKQKREQCKEFKKSMNAKCPPIDVDGYVATECNQTNNNCICVSGNNGTSGGNGTDEKIDGTNSPDPTNASRKKCTAFYKSVDK
jgi:hypothetical protein